MVPPLIKRVVFINRNVRFQSTFREIRKKKVIFLGTPSFASECLQTLVEESKHIDSTFDVVAVVTRPPTFLGKRKTPTLSSVHVTGNDLNIPVFTPEKASENEFINVLKDLNPDLCLTAAYGNYLPKKFLDIPKFGTLNIHPSLLPRYRGASPVQRALENGDKDVGVSVLFSIREMDAGPLLCQDSITLQGHEKSPEVVRNLFRIGMRSLLDRLPTVWSAEDDIDIKEGGLEALYRKTATAQSENGVILAPKISPEEGVVSFATHSALQIHNKCRAFAEWPGVWTLLRKESGVRSEVLRVKLVSTAVLSSDSGVRKEEENNIDANKDDCRKEITYNSSEGYMEVMCRDGSRLAVYELQPTGKKVMSAKAFNNGLKSRKLLWDSADS